MINKVPMHRYLLSGLIGLSYFLFSCQRNENLTENELKAYVLDVDNGLLKKNVREEVIVDCFYWPKELVLLNEYKNSLGTNDSILNITKRQLDSIDYFIVKYSPKKNPDRFSNAFSIQNSTQLIIDNDTIQVQDAISIPRQNSGSQSYSTLYAFKSFLNKRRSGKNIHLLINENSNMNEDFEFSNDDLLKVQKFSIIK